MNELETPVAETLTRLTPEEIISQTGTAMSKGKQRFVMIAAQAAELDPQAAAWDNQVREADRNHKNDFMMKSIKVIWLTSVRNEEAGTTPGRVFQMSPWLAAERLVGKTHRLSTPAEIEGWNKEQAERKKVAAEIAEAAKPAPPQIINNVVLPPEMLRALERGNKQQADK